MDPRAPIIFGVEEVNGANDACQPRRPSLPQRVPAGVIQRRPFQAVDIRDSPALSPVRKDFDEPARR